LNPATSTVSIYPQNSSVTTGRTSNLTAVILYGEAMGRQYSNCRYDKVHIKKAKLPHSLSFLMICSDQSMVLHFLQFQNHVYSKTAKKTY
jgi:hypothetical protein